MTEAGYVSSYMEQLALSHQDISFKYMVNGQTKLHSSGNASLKDVIYGIYGRDIARELTEVKYEKSGISIEGFAGKPVIARGNRTFENYYINGRYVKSKVIMKAIEDAYKPYMMQHKYPFVCLQYNISGEEVDVNVHPTKMEVRFQNQQAVYQATYEALTFVLAHRELIPDIELNRDTQKEARENAGRNINGPEPFEQKRRAGLSHTPQPHAEHLYRQQPQNGHIAEKSSPYAYGSAPVTQESDFGKNAEITNTKEKTAGVRPVKIDSAADISGVHSVKTDSARINIPGIHSAETDSASGNISGVHSAETNSANREIPGIHSAESESAVLNIPGEHSAKPGSAMTDTQNMSLAGTDSGTADFTEASSVGQKSQEISSGHVSKCLQPAQALKESSPLPGQDAPQDPAISEKPQQMELFDDRLLSKKARLHHRIIGQLFDTYWLVEYDEKFYIIDQHAAHEKVLYERFMKEFDQREIISQMISPPEIIALSLQEAELLKEQMEIFEQFGFEISSFGGKEYSISAVPANLYGVTVQELFIEILDSLESEGRKQTPELITHRIATAACKAAVKGNQMLSVAEADKLIDELLGLENPYHCPHGRPTIISMTKYELEKKFKRIV